MQTYSTAQVAKKIEVSKLTLTRWLLAGKVKEPRRVSQGGQEVRIWTVSDVERVRKYKQENYRKGRGRKARKRKGDKT
jgi:hypothetical protein